jgi:pyruvate,water dikinase
VTTGARTTGETRHPSKGRRILTWLGRAARAAWHGFLWFLEAIGLRAGATVDQEAQVARLRLFHTELRRLISANNGFLQTLAELEQLARSAEPPGRHALERHAIRAVVDVHAMIESLNVVSSERYRALREVHERIKNEMSGLLASTPAQDPEEIVLSFSDEACRRPELVGGKVANLAVIGSELGLPIPPGFAITTRGFRMLLEGAGLRSWSQALEASLETGEDAAPTAAMIRERLLGLVVPDVLEAAIVRRYDAIAERAGAPLRVAVRSSAVGEDSHVSYAGQFLTELDVGREGLVRAYIEVLSSLYSPEAITYRRLQHVTGDVVEMAVGVVAMIEARASGVAFSRDPSRPDGDHVVIQAVRGLGVPLVEGRTVPEQVSVGPGSADFSIRRTPAQQETCLVHGESGGVAEEPVPPEQRHGPFVSDAEAALIARWARQLEAHFGCPQDVEWAIDRSGAAFLLQSRPLRQVVRSDPPQEPVVGASVLLNGGEVACPGAGTGTVTHMTEDDDLAAFPDGGVLVSRRSSPRFVRVMSRARAIVTDLGSTTGHMATLARELRVPTLLNTRRATEVLTQGAVVTVDATRRTVYAGEVPGLVADRPPDGFGVSRHAGGTPAHLMAARVSGLIVPLNLTDPRSHDFAPDSCRSLHDVARFAHEMVYAEMFGMHRRVGDLRAAAVQLDVFLPIDLYLIDLGGGLAPGTRGHKVKRTQVTSVPMAALLRGMLNRKLPRYGPRPIDLSGFMSVVMQHALSSPDQDRSFHDPCYALISDAYVNYTARVGYHFSVVDSYCGVTANKNYLNVLFRGGAADHVRRTRRVRAITTILRARGFSAQQQSDSVVGRLSKPDQEETIAQLEMIGTLLQFFRQMDAAMTSDEMADEVSAAFLRGDYSLGGGLGQ